MSDTNRVAIGIVKESTFGEVPSNPAFQSLRITGTPNLAYEPQTMVSNEIRSDRQVADLILVGAQAGGDIGMEMSFGALDTMLEAALDNNWVRKGYKVNTTSGTPISGVTAADDTYTVDLGDSGVGAFSAKGLVYASGFTNAENNGLFLINSSTASTIVVDADLVDETPPAGAELRLVGLWATTSDLSAVKGSTNYIESAADIDFREFDLAVGDWIKIGGSDTGRQFATTANNGWCRISAITDTKLTFDIVPVGWADDDGNSKSIQIFFGDRIRNGTTKKSYTIERRFQDHSPITYEVFTGMVLNTLNINAPSKSIVTATANFMGKDVQVSNSRTSGATDVSAPANDVMNTTSNVGRIASNGVAIASPNYITEVNIQINNNRRRQDAVGELGSVGIGSGEFNISGNHNTYFGNKSLLEELINNTATSFDMRFSKNNKVMLFDLPNVKYSSGSPDVGGKNQDVFLNLGFQAIRHPTLLYTIKVQAFHYIPS
jgi:hypothetical protein